MLKKVESFLQRRISQLEKLTSNCDPRVSKDFDDEARIFKEVLSYVHGLMGHTIKPLPVEAPTVDLMDHLPMFSMLNLVSKNHCQINSEQIKKS